MGVGVLRDGIIVSLALRYPELIDVDTVLGTVEGRLVKTRIFEEPQQLRICYPMPLEGFSTAKVGECSARVCSHLH